MRTKSTGIREELKQARRFSGPAEEATVALLRTADVVRRDLEETLGENGLTVQQYNVLRILRGSHPDPIATLEIAERMIERAPGITRLLDRLERTKLVRRERCKEDRRRVWCYVTDKGLALLDRADGPVRATEKRRAGRLQDRHLATLLQLLDQLRGDIVPAK